MCRELNDHAQRLQSDGRPTTNPIGSVIARSERLVVRQFVPDDLAALVALHNDPVVMLYLNNAQPVPKAEVSEELTAWIDEYRTSDEFGCWAMDEGATDRFIGWIHFRPGNGLGELEPELGFRLQRFFWGRGFATEAAATVIDRGFTRLPIERVYAHTMSVHRASRRVMEKAGMRMVRMFRADWPVRIPGDEYGDVEYAVTRADWVRAGRQAGPPVERRRNEKTDR